MQLHPLHLCEISVLTSILILSIQSRCNYAVNVALNKKSTQLGGDSYPAWPASTAVDGDKTCTEPATRDHFSLTTTDSNLPWWQVDLDGVYEVASVVVYGRPESPPVQLHGFYLLLSVSSDDQQVRFNSSVVYSQRMEIKVNNIAARYIRIEMPGTYRPVEQGPLALCEVDVNGYSTTNLIPTIKDQVSTNMSTSYKDVSPPHHPWESQRAINGRYPGVGESPEMCDCCSATAGARDTQGIVTSWWMLNLGMKYQIKNILAIGRDDDSNNQLGGFSLYLSNSSTTSPGATNTTKGQESRYNIQVDNILAQYITIKRNGFLTLCELQVVEGECPIGTYGDRCLRNCYCSDDKACNILNGTCSSSGCKPGHQGPACETVCGAGFYGANCNDTCGTCKGGVTCNDENGHCPGGCLLPGVKPPICKDDCDDGDYGYNCTNKCGHCLNDSPCHKVTGNCIDCAAGYTGPICNTNCPVGTYGDGCSRKCYCVDGKACDKLNGTCSSPGCKPGHQGPACETVCESSFYGANCNQTCGACQGGVTCNAENGHCPYGCLLHGVKPPVCKDDCDDGDYGYNCTNKCGHCLDDIPCDKVTGHCIDCAAGYTGPICNTKCEDGYYGIKCGNECGHCLGARPCNKEKGNCTDCAVGYTGPICKIPCSPGHYGPHCSFNCSWNCRSNQPCNIADGGCAEGCDRGYTGVLCNITCTDGYFGYNCDNSCGNCKDNATCDTTTGTCSHGCSEGYMFDNCTTASKSQTNDGEGGSNSSITIGAVVSAFVVAALVVGTIFVLKRKGLIFAKSTPTQRQLEFASLEDDVVKPQAVPIYQEVKKPKKKMNDETSNEKPMASNEYYSFAPRKADIKVHQIWDYIHDKMKEKCESFYKDFGLLKYGLDDSHKIALLPENQAKNRYKEMFAYDHSRVPLVAKCTGESEYINASFIDGYEKAAKFIASQGPIKVMIDDFWRMVWQQRSDTIVMLTNLMEFGSQKCIQYWPEKGEKSFERITVEMVKTETFLDFNIRHLKIRQGNESPRAVTQYHFKSWPDKDVPDSAWCLVNFWRVVNRKQSTNDAGPIVVHCSAGVGRTGTYIALDNLFNQVNAEGSVRPLQMVETLRRQRVNMVQTKEQYVYLHEALAEALLFGTHYIWSNQFDDFCKYMSELDPTTTKVRLRIQYDLIVQSLRTEAGPSTSSESEYASVYEYEAASESDAYRPKRKNKRLKYIQDLDAVYLPNYNKANAYLVTASPNKKIMEEFWSLVDEQNVKTIVVMADTPHTNNKLTGRLATGSLNVHGKYTVNYLEEKHRKGFTESVLTFKESEKNDEDLVTVKQFHYTAWKNGYNVPGDTQSMLDLVDAIHIWQPHATITQPIIIHCGNGENTRTGVVCVLLNELQRMRLDDGHINIVESVKTMKQRNKDIIANYEQYQYCHDVILAHIKQTNEGDVYQNI